MAAGDPHPKIAGIIRSAPTKANVVFSARETTRGVSVSIQMLLRKIGFIRRSARDYGLRVNPPTTVAFPCGLSAPLCDAVLADLVGDLDELDDDTGYHLESELVECWVERLGDYFEIHDADWRRDMYEVEFVQGQRRRGATLREMAAFPALKDRSIRAAWSPNLSNAPGRHVVFPALQTRRSIIERAPTPREEHPVRFLRDPRHTPREMRA